LPALAPAHVIHSVNSHWADVASRAGDRAAAVVTPRAVRLAAALAGLVVIGTYLAIALGRLTYPFTLEWLESNSLVEVHRILAGQPLYAAPTAGYVPDGYPPLYFATSAAVASVTGASYLPLRLVSLVSSLACFALLARLVQRETGSAGAGISAAGLLAATYFVTGTWFDVGRVDSLFLALSVAALYAARWMCRPRGAIAAGLLLGAAFLTKQTGLAEGVAVLAALALGPRSRRRLALLAALAYGAALGISTLALGLASHGWYVYYVFEQMSEHTLNPIEVTRFWTGYLWPTLGLASCALVIGARRTPLVLVAGCAALVAEGYATLVHTGGVANDLLPAYLVVALLAGLAMGPGPRGLVGDWVDRLAAARLAYWRPGWTGPWIAAAAGGLVIAQLAALAGGFHPSRAIPASADRLVGWRLTAGVRALGGAVAIPSDPGIALLAGMPPVAQQAAASDVLRASDQAAIASFTRSTARAVAARQFSAIIVELSSDLQGFPPDLMRYYRRCPQMLLAGVPGTVFIPVAGIRARPVSVWLPVGRGSCATAVRVLDGSVTGTASALPRQPHDRPNSTGGAA
jgi:hypothetical protein